MYSVYSPKPQVHEALARAEGGGVTLAEEVRRRVELVLEAKEARSDLLVDDAENLENHHFE